MDVMTLRRSIITGNHRLPFRERTVIGNPVSFRTNADKPLNELLIPFLPIQQGTGDPSLENIRHIIGRQGLTTFRGADQTDYDSYPVTFPTLGKNLFNPALAEPGYYTDTGAKHAQSGSNYEYRMINYIPVDGIEKITVGYANLPSGSTKWNSVCWYDENKTFISRSADTSGFGLSVFMVPANAKYVRGNMRTFNQGVQYCFLALGEESFEPFDNTIYGGTLDAVNRVLMVWWVQKILNGTESWQNVSGQGGNPRYFRTEIGAYGYAESQAIYCDQFVQAIITASTNNIGINISNSTSANKSFISFRPGIEGITTSAGLSEYLVEHPVQTVYKLSTPIEIPIDQIIVQTLIGDNTIWSDTGEDMTVTYLKRG